MIAKEQALVFACAGEWLVGVLAMPGASTHGETAVIVVVGGPQYRVGSHRQFALLARTLAHAGFATLRFDVRGMGDSSGAQRSFETLDDDIAAAIDAVQSRLPDVRQVVLWGLCDGASAALLYWHGRRDSRVRGLCLLNPWVRSPASMAMTHVKHYYWRRLAEAAFWRKLLSGKVGRDALAGLWANLRLARTKRPTSAEPSTFQQRMAHAWAAFPGDILLVLSEDDYTAREFIEHAGSDAAWHGCLSRVGVTRLDVSAANHTFSDMRHREFVESATLDWLAQLSRRPSQREHLHPEIIA